jgi:hypothetical protein
LDFGALAGELFGEAFVVEMAGTLQAVYDIFEELVVFGAAAEELLHFVDGIGAAHESADGGFVELGLGFDLARLGEHARSIEAKN